MKGRRPKTAVTIYWSSMKCEYPSRVEMSRVKKIPLSIIRYKLYCLRKNKQLSEKVKKISPCCFARLINDNGKLVCERCNSIIWEAGRSDAIKFMAHNVAKKEYRRFKRISKRKTVRRVSLLSEEEQRRLRSTYYMKDAELLVRSELKKMPNVTQRQLEVLLLKLFTNSLDLP